MPGPLRMSTVARPLLVFCLVYFPVLAGWIAFKHYYTMPVACSGAKIAAVSLDAHLDSCRYENGGVTARFTRDVVTPAGVFPARSGIKIDDNRYTFNAPITLAMLIVTSLLMHISWQSWSKALLALVLGHLCFTWSCFLYRLQQYRVAVEGGEIVSTPPVHVQIFWDFCNSMLIRFEPFLILAVLVLAHHLNARNE